MPEAAESAYRILERKRGGASLGDRDVAAVVAGAVDGSWSEAQLAAFLMAGAIHGLDAEETLALTREMVRSGDEWDIAGAMPRTIDKHSTGGVGDKVSMLVAPILAACGRRVAKLTGRGLGHTGGTADKLETIPGLELAMSRERCLDLLAETGIAIGIATDRIAPADRRLYGLRNETATVDCLAFVVSSILSKKLALGAETLVFDVKTGNGSFFADSQTADRLARLLVDTAAELGRRAVAVITDMSQPLGRWAGHRCELREVLEALDGDVDERLLEVVLTVAGEACRAGGEPCSRDELAAALTDGRARERFVAWAVAQGADPDFLAAPSLPLAPVELVAEAPRDGVVSRVATRDLGLLLFDAGAGRR
ncbi:MAG: thymidine phosphorylase, partial [Thermoanaerobaculia bacterium]|nr:thymidine phosphorylase [Thermoanaerobaculia bacterium]